LVLAILQALDMLWVIMEDSNNTDMEAPAVEAGWNAPLEETDSAPPSMAAQSERTSSPRPSPADEAEIAATVEAILFATDAPLAPGKIAQVAELGSTKVVKQAIRTLNERYEQMGCSFRIEEIGGGFQMLTLPQYHDVLGRLSKARGDSKLSRAAMETLAIIAYRQPIIRADIEAIRGVASGEVLRGLMEKQLVKVVGREEVIGRPMLYGTTRRFLEVFGLGGLEDLPRVEELRTGAKSASKPAPETSGPALPPATGAGSPAAEASAATSATPADSTEAAPPPADQNEPSGQT
jgi:segregation and condensation protein B